MSRTKFNTEDKTRQRMRNVRVSNTDLEKAVRSILHRSGYRFSLRQTDLIGKPDIVLPKHHTVIFVNGCFWHGHELCYKGTHRPKRNAELWERKITYNRARDVNVQHELERLGWRIIVVWECELKDQKELRERIEAILGKS